LAFTHLEIIESGGVLCCCWGKYDSLADLKKQTISQAWNSGQFQRLRKKIYQNHLTEVCDSGICHIILSHKFWCQSDLVKLALPERFIKEVEAKKTRLSDGPFKITLTDIGTCNLRCKMCYRYYVKEDRDFSQKLIWERLAEFLNEKPQRRLVIKLTGNGDPFVRRETREFLQQFKPKTYPNVSFEILTNGLLLDKKMWQAIKHNRIDEINVSIDAASKETYESIRRGGNWERLMSNLQFISQLRQKGKIKYFYINMVVMKSNYREMKKFVSLAESLKCDEVNFQRITGLFNLEENINDFPDPAVIKAIAQTLKSSTFKSRPGFTVNTLQLKDYLSYKPRVFEKQRAQIKLSAYRLKQGLNRIRGKVNVCSNIS